MRPPSPADRELRLGLLGAGPWGQRYIQTIGSLPGLRLAVVASRNPETARRVPAGCRIETDWRRVVADPEVDAVVVATPPALHASMVLAAIDAGKPVLVEKPMTLSVDDAKEIERNSRERGVFVMVDHTQLFNNAFRRMKRALPDIAPVRRIVSNSGKWGPFKTEPSALWDFAPHDVAMCIDLLEAVPTKVKAKREVHDKVEGGFGDRYFITLTFPRSITAEIRTGNLLRPKRRWLEVQGEKGTLFFDDLADHQLVRRAADTETPVAYERELPLTTAVREFASAARFGSGDRVSVQLGREVVEVLAACTAQFSG